MNIAEIKDLVRSRYGAFAEAGGAQVACCSAMAQPVSGCSTDLGLYSAEELALVPGGALSLSRGCGNPVGFAGLNASEAVVDFGCGGGIDVILAAHKDRQHQVHGPQTPVAWRQAARGPRGAVRRRALVGIERAFRDGLLPASYWAM